MQFYKNLDKNEYIEFCKKNENAHFLQSYEWGQCSKRSRDQIPMYVGLKDDNNNIVAAALLLKKKTPLNMCYYYSPRGFVIDYKKKSIFKEFTESLKKLMKEENAIYLRIDPGVMYQEIDEEANKIPGGCNNYSLYNDFIELGFKHQGFVKLYEGNQPRYTFRINLKRPFDEVNSAFSKTFMKTVKRSYNYDLEIVEGSDMNIFHDLTANIANKNGFTLYDKNYYKAFYEEFSKESHVKVFNAIIYPDKILDKFQNELNTLLRRIEDNKITKKEKGDVDNIIKRLKQDIELFTPLKGKYENGKVVCSLICSYTDYSAWTLYIGNDDLGTYTFAVNRCYYESIVDAHKKNYQFIDLFGTVGDPHTKFKNLAGLHDFKRKFGGDYVEFIGEFDLINKPFWYFVLPKLLWLYRKLKR